jgi:hypothetical protein
MNDCRSVGPPSSRRHLWSAQPSGKREETISISPASACMRPNKQQPPFVRAVICWKAHGAGTSISQLPCVAFFVPRFASMHPKAATIAMVCAHSCIVCPTGRCMAAPALLCSTHARVPMHLASSTASKVLLTQQAASGPERYKEVMHVRTVGCKRCARYTALVAISNGG